MGFGLTTSKKQLISVFKGRDVLIIPMEKYSLTMNLITRNIKNIPESITHELAYIHDKETGRILQEADLRGEARTALVSHIDIKDKDSKNLQIVSMSDVGAFFEFGVKEHFVP